MMIFWKYMKWHMNDKLIVPSLGQNNCLTGGYSKILFQFEVQSGC